MQTNFQDTWGDYPNGSFSSRSDYRSGADDPKKRALNPYFRRTYDGSFSGGKVRYLSGRIYFVTLADKGFRYGCTHPWFVDPRSALTPDIRLRLNSGLRAQIRNSKFNVAMNVAEGLEAIAMIRETALKAASALSSVRKGNLKRAAAVYGLSGRVFSRPNRRTAKRIRSKDISEAPAGYAASCWLQLQLGWLPTFSAAADAGQFIGEMVSKSQRLVFSTVAQNSSSLNSSFSLQRLSMSARATFKVTAVLRSIPPAHVDYGIENPYFIAWNLLPLSFVADWFYPFGKVVNQVNQYHGVDFESCFVNVKTNVSCSAYVDTDALTPDLYTVLAEDGNFGQGFGFIRESYDPTAFVLPELKPPSSFLESLWKVTTSIALIRSIFF